MSPTILPTLSIQHRPRRLRRTDGLRRMVQESHLTVADLIYSVFVMEGSNVRGEIESMPATIPRTWFPVPFKPFDEPSPR